MLFLLVFGWAGVICLIMAHGLCVDQNCSQCEFINCHLSPHQRHFLLSLAFLLDFWRLMMKRIKNRFAVRICREVVFFWRSLDWIKRKLSSFFEVYNVWSWFFNEMLTAVMNLLDVYDHRDIFNIKWNINYWKTLKKCCFGA